MSDPNSNAPHWVILRYLGMAIANERRCPDGPEHEIERERYKAISSELLGILDVIDIPHEELEAVFAGIQNMIEDCRTYKQEWDCKYLESLLRGLQGKAIKGRRPWV